MCIVAKSSAYHVTEALQTTLDEGAAMIADSVRYLAGHDRMVLVDMEHFFDGYRDDREFSLRALEAAVVSGATHVVLCDTNGGSLPDDVFATVQAVVAHVGSDVTVGIHCHDDTGCAVANSMAAVAAGARHVQGTLNGLGERTGNANLTTIIPNLQLKRGTVCLPEGRLDRLTSVSHHVAELLNRAVNPQAPYVGSGAFAHKAGLHVSAIARRKDAYEHVDPELVGNRALRRQRDGRARHDQHEGRRARHRARRPGVYAVIDDLKRLEHEGYHFERRRLARAVDAARRLGAVLQSRVDPCDRRHRCRRRRAMSTEATAKVWVKTGVMSPSPRQRAGQRHRQRRAAHAARRLSGARTHPSDRLQGADPRRSRCDRRSPRVLLDADGERDWTTIGVSPSIIDASWRALSDSIVTGSCTPR